MITDSTNTPGTVDSATPAPSFNGAATAPATDAPAPDATDPVALHENDLHEVIGDCPTAGAGVHRWIFRAALDLSSVEPTIACRVIARAVARCGRDVPRREIEEAVRNARNEEGRSENTPEWPEKNHELIHEIAKCGPTLAELGLKSPVLTANLTSRQVIEALFPGDPLGVLLCVGKRKEQAVTRPKVALRGQLDQQQFVVPNPMSAMSGKRKGDGEKSARCLDNTGSRRFLVVESDPVAWDAISEQERATFGTADNYIKAKKDAAAAVLSHLAERAPSMPLVLVVDSAHKSVHGWFRVERAEEEKVIQFFRYAVALGADPATWVRCQFVRMPGGLRDNEKRQSIIYFNPHPLKTQ